MLAGGTPLAGMSLAPGHRVEADPARHTRHHSGPRLTKWYLDCIDEGGRVVIGYAARLQLAGFEVPFMEVLLDQPHRPRRVERSWTTLQEPASHGEDVVWKAPAIGIEATWHPRTPPVRRTLLERAEGSIDWHCRVPCGTVRVSLQPGPTVVEGLGCVEELDVTIAPWRLPLDRLRWGHFVSATHDMMWIDWAGPHPLTLVFLNGTVQPSADVADSCITTPDGRLTLHPGRTVRRRSVAHELGLPPRVAQILPDRMRSLFEHKWLSRATLGSSDGTQVDGWALHEQVQFR